MWSITIIKKLKVFYEFTNKINHRFLTNQNARTILRSYFININNNKSKTSQPLIIPTSLTLWVFHLPFEVGNSWLGKNSPIKIKVFCQKKKSLQNVRITSITAVGLEKNSSRLYITEPPNTPLCEVIGQPINLMLLSVAVNRLLFLGSILLCTDSLRAYSLVLDWGRFRRRIPYRARKIHFSLCVGSCSAKLFSGTHIMWACSQTITPMARKDVDKKKFKSTPWNLFDISFITQTETSVYG